MHIADRLQNKFKSFAKQFVLARKKNRSYRENKDLTLKADENYCFRGTDIPINDGNEDLPEAKIC